MTVSASASLVGVGWREPPVCFCLPHKGGGRKNGRKPMPASDSSRDALLERLAEEFVERHRRGEHPALSEYTDRHPDLAAEIRDLFPAMVQVERLKPAAGDLTGAFLPDSSPEGS